MSSPPFLSCWPRPLTREYSGQQITLRPLCVETDAQALFAASHGTASRETIWDYLWYGPFPGFDEMKTWLGTMAGLQDPLFLTVHQGTGHKPVGMVSILNIAPEMGRAELGHIWYAPEVQRSKVNTEAIFLLLRHLFDELGYRRVEWKCDSRNDPSQKAALRLGFSFEGRFRQHMVIKGMNRDTLWFSILDHEWPRLRVNFNRWLYEDDTVSLAMLNKAEPA